jgi:hypothetical protein
MYSVLTKHDTPFADAESFVAVAALLAPNRADKHKRQHRMLEHAFPARDGLLKSVTTFTLKSWKRHYLIRLNRSDIRVILIPAVAIMQYKSKWCCMRLLTLYDANRNTRVAICSRELAVVSSWNIRVP